MGNAEDRAMPRRQSDRPVGPSREDEIDMRAVMGCTCMHLRRTTRRVTQLFDRIIEPAGITSGQFGLLARLYAAKLRGEPGLPIGVMAEQHGMDSTTLNRNLKPLLTAGLVDEARDPGDRRVRMVVL